MQAGIRSRVFFCSGEVFPGEAFQKTASATGPLYLFRLDMVSLLGAVLFPWQVQTCVVIFIKNIRLGASLRQDRAIILCTLAGPVGHR